MFQAHPGRAVSRRGQSQTLGSKEWEGKVNIGKVNVDNNPQLSMNYGITSIPAILFIKGGVVVDKLVGAQPKNIFVKKIESHV